MLEKIQHDYFDLVDFELVIYDETETFRDHDSDQFHYPYGPRKTTLNKFNLHSNLWFNDTGDL